MKNIDSKHRILTLVFGVLCLSSLGGSTIQQPINYAWADDTTPPDMVVTEKNNGNTVKLKTGQMLEVRLESNATTGYEWTVIKHDETILEIIGKPKYIAPIPGPDGASGQQIFMFKGRKTGSTELRLIYARPFETGKAPLRIFNVTLDIQ